MPILIAMGLVIFLGATTLTNQMFENQNLKKAVARVNKQEAFFATEIAAWTNTEQSGKDNTPVVFSNDYLQGVNLTSNFPSPYAAGTPLNVAVTARFDKESAVESHSLIRRYDQVNPNIVFRVPASAANSYCGTMNLGGRNSERLCLKKSAVGGGSSPPSLPQPLKDCSGNVLISYPGPAIPIGSPADLAKVTPGTVNPSGTSATGNFYYITNDFALDGSQGIALPIVLKFYFDWIEGNGHTITVKNMPTPGALIGTQPGSSTDSVIQNLKFDLQSPYVSIIGNLVGHWLFSNVQITSSTGMFWGTGVPITYATFASYGIFMRGLLYCGDPVCNYNPASPVTSTIEYQNVLPAPPPGGTSTGPGSPVVLQLAPHEGGLCTSPPLSPGV